EKPNESQETDHKRSPHARPLFVSILVPPLVTGVVLERTRLEFRSECLSLHEKVANAQPADFFDGQHVVAALPTPILSRCSGPENFARLPQSQVLARPRTGVHIEWRGRWSTSGPQRTRRFAS